MYYDWLWLKEGNCGLTTCTGTLYIVWHCGGQLTRQAVISIWWPFYTGNMNIIYLRHLPLQSYIISLITLSMYWQKKCIYTFFRWRIYVQCGKWPLANSPKASGNFGWRVRSTLYSLVWRVTVVRRVGTWKRLPR